MINKYDARAIGLTAEEEVLIDQLCSVPAVQKVVDAASDYRDDYGKAERMLQEKEEEIEALRAQLAEAKAE